MAEEGKKISFGFAKSIKKPVLKNVALQEEKKVDYIECLDGKAIKVIGREEKKDEPLVIPLLGSKTWHDRIINKVDADIFEPKPIKSEDSESTKKESEPDISNGNASLAENLQSVKVKIEPTSDNGKSFSLEEQAAKEIIEELKTTDENVTVKKELTLPLTKEETLRGQAESTLEDYEKIPIDAFGLAMLRGMGWQPGKGIGKNEKLVPAVVPELRPKGMGLGADKVTLQKQAKESKKQEEELKIEKGTFVKFIAGKQSNTYGQIEGLDDDAGRLIIKLALGGQIVSVNEFMVQPVSKSEYTKNSKVLNAKKFEEFKEKQTSKKKAASSSDESENTEEDKQNHRKDSKKKSSKHRSDERDMKSRKRHSSESDNSSDYGKKSRHRSRSSSSDSHKSKKVKKSKKHKKCDSSPERSSRKYKKKDKERTKDKQSRDSKYGDRRKRKKHRRSRSRS